MKNSIWLKSIKNSRLSANNISKKSGICLCFNFIEIPESDTDYPGGVAVLTVSVMKDGARKNALNPQIFAQIMSGLEENLSFLAESEGIFDIRLCTPTHSELPKNWYTTLGCHRVFFIPIELIWKLIPMITTRQNMYWYSGKSIELLTLVLQTSSYNGVLKFKE